MHYYESMKSLIGKTPLVKLNHVGVPEGVNLFVKLELWNPSGSVKDRAGLYMVEDAFAPTKFSQEKQTLLRALGAELINTPREEGMLGAEKKAEELLKQIPDSISLRQFHNMANPRAHYETTGPEIYDDLEGNVDYVVAGAGSGGTFSGILKALKERNPKIQGVLADPVGSTMGGGEHGDYNIEGIGNDFIADTMDMSLVDRVIKINDDDAFGGSRELAQKEGIFAGSSSGGAFAAAKKLIASGARGNIVFVAPDRGDRYFSKGLYK